VPIFRRLHYWLKHHCRSSTNGRSIMAWGVAFPYLFNLPLRGILAFLFFDSKNKGFNFLGSCYGGVYHSLLWLSCAIQMIKKTWCLCTNDAIVLLWCTLVVSMCRYCWLDWTCEEKRQNRFVRCDDGIFDDPNKCIE